MIIGENRKAVIENIKELAERGAFNAKAELTDPVLTDEESRKITLEYTEYRSSFGYKLKRFAAVSLTKAATRIINKNTEIVGLERVPDNASGMLITVNHFNPLENTVIRHMLSKMGRKKLNIISQTSNFAMSGFIGFIMNYADTIPISSDPRYLAKAFPAILKEKICDRGEAVLLYPEQEMWFNYRKPRPPKNGAYFYAAKLGIPILSCFTEIRDTETDDTDEFKRVKYILHVLELIYPDNEKSVRENTEALAQRDYELKKSCYEAVYGKKLTYSFESTDIAGFKGTL